MRLLEADEVVAAVVRGAEDDAVAGSGELGYGLGEGGVGDGGGVGVDERDGGEAAGEDVFGGGEEALAKGVAALGDEAEVIWEETVKGGFIADGGVADKADGGGGEAGEVFRGVHEEADVERGGLGEGERGGEAGFDLAGAWGLGHDGEGVFAGKGWVGCLGEEDLVGHSSLRVPDGLRVIRALCGI